MLEVKGLNVFYGKTHAVKDVSFKVEAGKALAVLGKNGAGKTTLVKTVVGLLKPATGSVTLNGLEVSQISPHVLPRRGVGYVPQGRGIFPGLTVKENLQLAVEAGGSRGHKIALEDVLEIFPPLKAKLNMRAGRLSGGEQQMLSVARALCSAAKLLVMDEPTGGLMPRMVERLLEALKTLKARGVGMLVVEQRIDVAVAVAEEILVLERGQVKGRWSREEAEVDRYTLMEQLGLPARL